MTNATQRFTKTVNDYIKYRPSYPKELLDVLERDCGLTTKSIVADVGSGTGNLAKLLLDHGNTVYGVEPNQAMRNAAENILNEYNNFISVNGTAERTTLADQAVDLVTVGTAFHWFDAVKAKKELQRILKPNGWIVLIWNVRNTDGSRLLQDYESLIIKYGTDYEKSRAQRFEKGDLKGFFAPNPMFEKSFPYKQIFDWKGLKGRLLSTSYSPRSGDVNYDAMIKELRSIFDRHQSNGEVDFLYNTKLYYGKLHSGERVR